MLDDLMTRDRASDGVALENDRPFVVDAVQCQVKAGNMY